MPTASRRVLLFLGLFLKSRPQNQHAPIRYLGAARPTSSKATPSSKEREDRPADFQRHLQLEGNRSNRMLPSEEAEILALYKLQPFLNSRPLHSSGQILRIIHNWSPAACGRALVEKQIKIQNEPKAKPYA
jgi:hypothetical protein